MIKKICFVLATCFFSFLLFSQEVSIAPQPKWLFKINENSSKKPNNKLISNGYYLYLFDNQVDIQSQTNYTHIIRVIDNESGVQNASEASVSFAPQYQRVIFHKVSVLRNGKEISSVALNQIKVVQEETEAANFQYNGMKRAYVVLKDVRKGDRIDFAYSVIGFNPAYLNIFSDEFYFSKGTEIVHFFSTLLAPADRKLNIRTYNDAVAPEKIPYNNVIAYHWNNPVLKSYESITGVPSWYTDGPYVAVTEFKDWAQVCEWGIGLFKNKEQDISQEIKQLSDEWKKTSKGNKEIYGAKAIRFVQDEIRYLGFEIGENTHVPYSPTTVFNQRYGDCKDKALLLMVLLRMNDIPSSICLVNTDYGMILNTKLPSQLEFDHAIVAIDQPGGKYKFIDPTISFQRGGMLETFTPKYGYGLVLKKGINKLVEIEAGPRRFTSILENIKVGTKDEPSKLYVESIFEGGAADNNRYDLSTYSTSELEKNYTQYYSKYYDSVILDKDIIISDDTSNNTVKVIEEYSIPVLWKKDDKGRDAFSVFAKMIYDLLPDPKENDKNLPLALSYPYQVFYKLKLEMPSEWPMENETVQVKNDAYQFDFEIYTEADTIFLEYRFITFKDHIASAEMAQYRKDYEQMQSVLQYEFYSGLPSKQTGASGKVKGNHLSPITLFLILLLSFGSWILFKKLNRRSADVFYQPMTSQAIGGWVIVLGLTLLLNLIFNSITLGSNFLITGTDWDTLYQVGGIGLQIVGGIEISIFIIWLLFNLAILYWYAKRRDIFPKMFMAYVASIALGHFIILLAYQFIEIPKVLENIEVEHITGIVRSIIYGSIWITYLQRSERVKTTFLIPYLYQPNDHSHNEATDETTGISDQQIEDSNDTPDSSSDD